MMTLVRFTISCGVAALLAGCGGLPAGSAQGRFVQDVRRIGAEPATSQSDLLYATTTGNTYVYIMSYPTIKVLHRLGPFKAAGAPHLCADNTDVYVLAPGPISKSGHYEQSYIYRYKRGATTPTRVFKGPTGERSCAADSASKDLAVITPGGELVIYPHSIGQPKVYQFSYYGPCEAAYGDDGKLYVIAGGCSFLAILEHGGLRYFSLNQQIESPLHIQWDNGVIVATTYARGWPSNYHQDVYLMKPEGGHKASVQLVEFDRKYREEPFKTTASWVAGNTFIAPDHQLGALNYWSFPAGGNPQKFVRARSVDGNFTGLVISAGS